MATDDFEFRVDRIKTQFSRDQMLASLKSFAESQGEGALGMREYNAWKGRICNADTIARYFENRWGRALQATGLRVKRGRSLDPKAMVEAFKRCWREGKSVPK